MHDTIRYTHYAKDVKQTQIMSIVVECEGTEKSDSIDSSGSGSRGESGKFKRCEQISSSTVIPLLQGVPRNMTVCRTT